MYPDSPGATKGVATSAAAAESVQKQASAQKDFLFDLIQTLGMKGVTIDEAVDHMKRAGFTGIVKNNVSARLGSICADGRAIRTDESRKSNYPGAREQSIYKAKFYEVYLPQPLGVLKAKQKGFCDQWRIWSNEHKAWWNPGSAGYAPNITCAGVYSFREAADICKAAGFDELGIPNETMLPIEDN